jgi:hypothetical protein
MAEPGTAHPLAAFLWSVLRDRSEADRRLVYEAARRRLGHRDTTEKQDLALEALHGWMRINESVHAPSRRQYDAFRNGLPERTLWPSATVIKNAFGGWSKAAAAADGRPEPDCTSRRLISNGRAVDREQTVAALREWEASLGDEPRRETDYFAWARKQLEDPDSPYTNISTSSRTIARLFGGWEGALGEVGALARRRGLGDQRRTRRRPTRARPTHPTAAAGSARPAPSRPSRNPSSRQPTRPPTFDLSTAPEASNATYSGEELIAWVRWAAAILHAHEVGQLTIGAYEDLRNAVLDQELQRNRPRRMPSAQSILRRFRSWFDAQEQAGLSPSTEIEQATRQPPYQQTALTAAMAEASHYIYGEEAGHVDGEEPVDNQLREVDTRLTEAEYMEWRCEILAEQEPDAPARRIPCAAVIRRHLGGQAHRWRDAIAAGQRELAAQEGGSLSNATASPNTRAETN